MIKSKRLVVSLINNPDICFLTLSSCCNLRKENWKQEQKSLPPEETHSGSLLVDVPVRMCQSGLRCKARKGAESGTPRPTSTLATQTLNYGHCVRGPTLQHRLATAGQISLMSISVFSLFSHLHIASNDFPLGFVQKLLQLNLVTLVQTEEQHCKRHFLEWTLQCKPKDELHTPGCLRLQNLWMLFPLEVTTEYTGCVPVCGH